jgi:hypothetical protein
MKKKTEWANAHDVWVLQTKIGRYVIRRAERGSHEFRLWLNKAPTNYYGTVVELQKTVDRILAVQR